MYVRYRGGCGGHAERKKISHSPLQRDFQRIRKIKKTTLKFYSVSNRAEEGGRRRRAGPECKTGRESAGKNNTET